MYFSFTGLWLVDVCCTADRDSICACILAEYDESNYSEVYNINMDPISFILYVYRLGLRANTLRISLVWFWK